jgi:hypothetical protein
VEFLDDYFRNSLAYLEYFQKHGATGSTREPMHWMKAWLDGWSKWSPMTPPSLAVSPAPEQPHATPSSEFAEKIAQLEQRIAELEQHPNAQV